MDATFAQLDDLLSLITSSIGQLKDEIRATGTPLPPLDSVDSHPFDTGAVPKGVENALRIVQGACAQLTTLVTPPQATISNVGLRISRVMHMIDLVAS